MTWRKFSNRKSHGVFLEFFKAFSRAQKSENRNPTSVVVGSIGTSLSDKVRFEWGLGPPGGFEAKFPAEATLGKVLQIPAQLTRNDFRVKVNGLVQDEIAGNFQETGHAIESIRRARGVQIGFGVVVDSDRDEIVVGNV